MSSQPKETSSGNAVNSSGQMDSYLEQVRSKKKPSRDDTWTDFGKQIRMATLDRQQNDTAVIGEALEKLRKVIIPQNLTQIFERIESACQKLRLKFSLQRSEQGRMSAVIAAEMFAVEVQYDNLVGVGPTVQDVLVRHHGTHRVSIAAMCAALKSTDVDLFMEHIRGFINMYNATSEQSVKTKFFIVQQSLETDLDKLNAICLQKNYTMTMQIFKLPLGLVESRNGGLPMKLTFFISSYDCLNEQEESTYPFTLDAIKQHALGTYALIGIDQHPNNHSLQTIPLLNVMRHADNRMTPQFQQNSNINSVVMPAAFYLTFKKPIALSQQVIKNIEKTPGCAQFSSGLIFKPLLEVIVDSSTYKHDKSSNTYPVLLPGMYQSYRIPPLKDVNGDLIKGALVSKLPFTHPTFLVHGLTLLRQQLAYNTLLMSCVRNVEGVVRHKPFIIELSSPTLQMISATMRNPQDGSFITVEFNTTEPSAPSCAIITTSSGVASEAEVNKVLHMSYSIPITVRKILIQLGYQSENVPPKPKRVKLSEADVLNGIVDHYTSHGHYVPYGSVNSTCKPVSNNIQTNQYSLCLRRFSGYKRSCVKSENRLFNPIELLPKSEPRLNLLGLKNLAPNGTWLQSTPMLASLLDDKKSAKEIDRPILNDLLVDKKERKPRMKRRPTSEGALNGSGLASRKPKKSDSDATVTKIKMEPPDMTRLLSGDFTNQDMSSSPRTLMTPTTPTLTLHTPTFPHQPNFPKSEPQEASLTKNLLSNPESTPTIQVRLKNEAVSLARPQGKPSNSREDRRKSGDTKEKKFKRTESFDTGTSSSKSPKIETIDSPIKVPKTPPIKVRSGKSSPKLSAQNLTLKLNEEPKKAKKVTEKKRKQKSPLPVESSKAAQQMTAAQQYARSGFYGASNLKSLPKIPKIKAESAPTEPQNHFNNQSQIINKPKLAFTPQQRTQPTDDLPRRALLPTPTGTPPLPIRAQNQWINSNRDSPSRLSTSLPHRASSLNVSEISSPEEPTSQPIPSSQTAPITIPTITQEPPPASPETRESTSFAPVAIPLDPNTKHNTNNHYKTLTERSISKSIPRTISFPTKPGGDRLDDDLMDVPLGCK